MAIGPRGPLLKNDGPACRVCGCTEHNACVIEAAADVLPLTERIAKAVRMPSTRMPRVLTCSWVSLPAWMPPLCTACAGTDGDLVSVLKHVHRRIRRYGMDVENMEITDRIARDAIVRWKVLKPQRRRIS